MAKTNKYRATLWIRKVFDKGLEGYWTWELILFPADKAPFQHAIANLVPQWRYGTYKDAIKAAENMAKVLDIKIDQRAYPEKEPE